MREQPEASEDRTRKRRQNRRRRRRILVWGGWGLVLLGGLGALFVWDTARSYESAIRSFERNVGPAEHALLVGTAVPAGENVVAAVPPAVEDTVLEGGWVRAPEPAAWTQEDQAEARTALAREMPAIATLERALGLPHCVWLGGPDDLGWSRAALSSSNLLRVMGFVGVLDGDPGLVERSFAGLGKLSDCLYRQPHLAGALVATAVSRSRLEVVRAAVASAGSEAELLDELAAGLEHFLEAGYVERAIAAEGAFALHFIEHPDLGTAQTPRGFVYPLFARRVATQFARRWVEIRAWSEQPLEVLLLPLEPAPVRRLAFTGVIADMVAPVIRDAVVRMRILEEQARLALLAIRARAHAERSGSYEGFSTENRELGTLREGDGGLVIIDSRLETLLRERYGGDGARPSPGLEAGLELAVWRLPPPREPLPE